MLMGVIVVATFRQDMGKSSLYRIGGIEILTWFRRIGKHRKRRTHSQSYIDNAY